MKTDKLRLLSACFAFVFVFYGNSAIASQALDPTDIGIGARPLGMGRAYTAIADDNSSLFTNPAGLDQKKSVKFLTMWGSLMAEVPYNVVGVSMPMWGGSFGLGYAGLQVGGIRETVMVGGVPEMTGNEGSFNNSSVNLVYATDLISIPFFSKAKVLSSAKAGVSVKMVSQGFSGFSSFEARELNGFDIDLGMITKINEETKFGLAFKNIIPGNNLGNDELPMSVNAGISRYFTNAKLLADLDIDIVSDRALLFRGGCEWSPVDLLKLRLGFDQKPNAGSAMTNMSAGVGLEFKTFSFDYAYHTFAGLPELSTHFFSICISGPELKDGPKKEIVKPLPPKAEIKKGPSKTNAKAVQPAAKKKTVPAKKTKK